MSEMAGGKPIQVNQSTHQKYDQHLCAPPEFFFHENNAGTGSKEGYGFFFVLQGEMDVKRRKRLPNLPRMTGSVSSSLKNTSVHRGERCSQSFLTTQAPFTYPALYIRTSSFFMASGMAEHMGQWGLFHSFFRQGYELVASVNFAFSQGERHKLCGCSILNRPRFVLLMWFVGNRQRVSFDSSPKFHVWHAQQACCCMPA